MEYILAILLVLIFITLIRIEINTKQKLENDERIVAGLDILIGELRMAKNKEDE